jgi:hypothetical protein
MNPVKIAGVAEWPTPSNKKEVQSFLGFTNFHRRFIQGFSDLARPMFDLTRKDSAWRWGEAEKSAFEAIRTRVRSDFGVPGRDPAHPSQSGQLQLCHWSSPPEDDKWHPAAYYSKSLNAVERNYKIHDKEMLAVIRALEDWRHFLEGAHHKFEIWTDHKNLEYFMTAKKLNRRQARWSLYLSRFNFAMHHRPGHSMGKSDTLSRRADHGTGAGDNSNVTLLRPEFFAAHAI